MGMIEIPIERREPVMRWIPCEERLPEVHRSILIATSQGYVAEGEYDGMYNDHHKWIQYRWSATLWDGEVIAYMPLPEPYKGDTDGKDK